MDGLLHGKTALVTGASRGIGRGIAERLALSGALVAVHYANNPTAADEVVSSIASAGGEAFAIQAEFVRPRAIEKLADELEAELLRRTGDDGLDVLVNNAGGIEYASVEETSERLF